LRRIGRVRTAAKIGTLLAMLLGAAVVWAAPPHDWGDGPFGWPSWPPGPYPHELRAGPPPRYEPLPPPPPRGLYGHDYHPHYGRWAPGEILPPDAPATVIDNPEAFHLRRPPRGYLWLSCDGDFILASATTGVIFEVIPGAGF